MDKQVQVRRSRPLKTAVITVGVIFVSVLGLYALAVANEKDDSQDRTTAVSQSSASTAHTEAALGGGAFPKPAEFISRWNLAATSRLDQLRSLDREGTTIVSPDNSYLLGYTPEKQMYSYLGQPNDQVQDMADRCAMMLHSVDPKLSLGDALTLVGRAGQAANPIRNINIDGVTFSIVRHDPIANCFVYPEK